MKVWWCDAHNNSAPFGARSYCNAAHYAPQHYPPDECQIVEMVLHPAGTRVVTAEALVIEKVDGEWPEWAQEVCEQFHYPAPPEAQDQIVKWTPTDLLDTLSEGP